MNKRVHGATIAIALLAVALSGCGSRARTARPGATTPTPAYAAEPTPWPTAQQANGVCTMNAPKASVRLWNMLPQAVTSADLLWYPGLNAQPCRSYVTHLDEEQATQLLADLRTRTPPVPGAIYHCPMDDKSFVQVWFQTTEGDVSFRIDLTGCAWYRPTNSADLGTWPYSPTKG